jgi:hypothetical protein
VELQTLALTIHTTSIASRMRAKLDASPGTRRYPDGRWSLHDSVAIADMSGKLTGFEILVQEVASRLRKTEDDERLRRRITVSSQPIRSVASSSRLNPCRPLVSVWSSIFTTARTIRRNTSRGTEKEESERSWISGRSFFPVFDSTDNGVPLEQVPAISFHMVALQREQFPSAHSARALFRPPASR